MLPDLLDSQGQINIDALRKAYLKVSENDTGRGADLVLKLLYKLNTEQNPTALAYQGAFETQQARLVINPFDKLKYTQLSQQTLAKAIELAPQNLEIRFLRYSIQLALPAFLMLSNQLHQDRQAIFNLIEQGQTNQHLSPEHFQPIADFLLKKTYCSPKEKELIRKFLG